MFCFVFRRYRDKERSEPDRTTTSTTPRATTPSEKKPTINVTVNPKSLSTTVSNVGSTTKSAMKPSKKIDMGAATNFGRDEIGINSPTHRNTHAEEDLFGSANISASTANKTDLLDDIFKTCSTTNDTTINTGSIPTTKAVDDFFNPRGEETPEFGDFASAFGNSEQATTQPDKVIDGPVVETKKNDFADFGSAFDATQSSSNTNNSANLLFSMNAMTPNAQITTSSGNQKVGDLLSDLDGLSLDVPVPTGKLKIIIMFILSFVKSYSFFTQSAFISSLSFAVNLL